MKSFFRSVFVITLLLTFAVAQYDLTREEIERTLAKLFPVGNSRIINGQDAEDGDFPYQLLHFSYALVTDTQIVSYCGASLIGAQWTLTAAHCLSAEKYVITGGSANRYYLSENAQYQTVLADGNAFVHPLHGLDGLIQYDIGVLKLTVPFTITDYLNLISLPTSTFNEQDYAGSSVIVSGWGYNVTDGSAPLILQHTTLTILANSDCTARTSPNLPYPTSFCALGGSNPVTSICQGDSGGALVLNINNEPIAIGINSYTIGGCENGYPSGFVRVAQFRDFIANNTGI